MKQLLALGLLAGITLGQQPPMPRESDMPMGGPQGERIEMMKMWKLTEALSLSEEQAQAFFPRYNTLTKELEDLGEKQHELLKEVGDMLDEGEKVSEKELSRILKEATEIEKQKIDKKREFFEKLGDVLTPEQKARYLVFEGRFKRELWKRVRKYGGFRPDTPGRHPGMKPKKWR